MRRRLLRVKELLKRELGEVLRRDFTFRDALVTVNDVDLTPDLKQAHVFVGIMRTSEGVGGEVIEELNRRRGFIQKKIFSRVVLKYTPQLHFREDASVERGNRVLSVIDSIEIPEGEGDDAVGGDEQGGDAGGGPGDGNGVR